MKQLLILLLLCFPYAVVAQTAPISDNWILSLQGGVLVYDVSSKLEKRMRSQGYAQTNSWLFGPNPMTRKSPLFQIGLEKSIQQSWSGKVLASSWSGYLNGVTDYAHELQLDYRIISTAMLIGFHTTPRGGRIAIGPALHFIQLDHTAGLRTVHATVEKNTTKLGFVAEAGVRFPNNTRLFIDLNTQYHFIGQREMGTYEIEDEDNYGYGYPNTSRFVAGSQLVDHMSFNIGLGMRFGKLLKERDLQN
jgi:hypothetical protein